jgi:RNA polymerase sigma-70 factor (ECF subfamily)
MGIEQPSSEDAVYLEAFDQHRSLLFSIAYGMLGSVADAEDMLQETFIRWQQTSHMEIRSPKAFLVTIVSRLSIDHLQSARVKREEYFGQWLPEPVMTGRGADPAAAFQIDESLSMGFLVLLELLTPVERAVFLLREVFDYEYTEIAGIVGQNETNCRQILRRARQHITEKRPRFDPSPQESEDLLRQFLAATLSGDMEGLLALLSSQIVLYTDGGGKATAVVNPIYGPLNVARLLFGSLKKFAPKSTDLRAVEINGQPGAISYIDGRADTVLALDISGGRINGIYVVRNPDKLGRLTLVSSAPN